MLFINWLENTDSVLKKFFSVHEQSGDDVYDFMHIAQAKGLNENTLDELSQRHLASGHACECAMAALVLWLAGSGRNLDAYENFCSAMQDYFQTQEWHEDEPLVLHYILKTFAYYFPQLTLSKCGHDQLGMIEELVESITSKVKNNIQDTGLEVPVTAYWVSKSLYPLYDTKRGDAPGKDFFIQAVQALFDHFINTEDVFHAEWIIRDMAECRCLDWPDYDQKVRTVADIYFDHGKKDKGIKAWHLLRQAGALYEKLSDHAQMDQCLRMIKDKKDNFDPEFQGLFQVPEEVQTRLDERCRIITGHLTSQKKQCSCFDLLAYFSEPQEYPGRNLSKRALKTIFQFLIISAVWNT